MNHHSLASDAWKWGTYLHCNLQAVCGSTKSREDGFDERGGAGGDAAGLAANGEPVPGAYGVKSLHQRGMAWVVGGSAREC